MLINGMYLKIEPGADLMGADLTGADLMGADLMGADLTGADLMGADLTGADLWGVNLRGANLRGADLWGVNLRVANLRGADLCGANLTGANLTGANLTDANLTDADLRCLGDMVYLKTMQLDRWGIGYTHDTLQIGCQTHSIDKWRRWNSEAGKKWIASMDPAASDWADKHLGLVLQIIAASPAKAP